ncbi:MAG: chloride channel protein, partial [Lentisphaerae bacterium]|nr:chloride channel protein [Lentisphaerota bacterium]
MKLFFFTARKLRYLASRTTPRRLMLILSFFVGILSGLSAVILKNTVHFTHNILQTMIRQWGAGFLYLALPGIGITLTVLYVKFFVKDDINHGISKVLYAMSRKGSKIKRHNTFTSIISSTITIGFGGSVGSEAPIVMTGSAIGSNIGQLFKQDYKTTTLLLGCGAAGAVAAIFKAPVAGLVFTLEVLMLDLTMSSLVPLLISAITATTLSYFLTGKEITFNFELLDPFTLSRLPYYILLGIFCGLVSLYFSRTALRVEGHFAQIKSPVKKLLTGAIALGFLIFVFPSLYGEGFDTLQSLIDEHTSLILQNSLLQKLGNSVWVVIAVLGAILFFKVFAMAATTGAGGIGGIFAPTLFMGGVVGSFLALTLNTLVGARLPTSNFTLIGMAGMMAGVMHAPLTAIFLIAEITGGYGLFIPLMITSTVAFLTNRYFEPHTIYTKRLAAQGDLITHHKDKAVLTLLALERVLETDFTAILPSANLGDLVDVI